MLSSIREFLQGKKTYLLIIIGVIVQVMQTLGIEFILPENVETIYQLLLTTTLGAKIGRIEKK